MPLLDPDTIRTGTQRRKRHYMNDAVNDGAYWDDGARIAAAHHGVELVQWLWDEHAREAPAAVTHAIHDALYWSEERWHYPKRAPLWRQGIYGHGDQ